jgi:DNA polymerase, archaea type
MVSMTPGWLFDVYPLGNKMIFWIKQENGNTIRLEDTAWNHSVYVAPANDYTDLLKSLREDGLIKECQFTSCYERIIDTEQSKILKLTLLDSTKALTLARKIETLDGTYRVYNVDLLPAQSYFYEHNIFPLALCEVDNHCSKLRWLNKDSVWSTDYKIPDFRTIHLTVNLRKEAKIPKCSDRIDSISVKQEQQLGEEEQAGESFEIQSKSEADIIQELIKVTKKIDPDFIFTEDGDSFTFPYLIHRAEENDTELIMGRESAVPIKKPIKQGISYFSYGRIYFKPTAINLLGRIHIDKDNSFIYNDSGLQGLYEVARICKMPLHTAARASIGKCLSSLQFYYAAQKGILVPWKPVIAEHFKTLGELLIADRGGFIFEPQIGVHEQVAEFDFVSLYPNIMLKKNLSAETINCNCCRHHNSKLRVPELNYNICEKRIGIIPTSLKIVLEKRAMYKHLLKSEYNIHPKLRRIYDLRQTSLKWILVTSFGYLGFNNAKFGRIDAHIAVCAFDRQILLQAAKISERCGFRVLHGIVDSIWVKKKGDEGNNIDIQDYLKLKESIEKETGFKISFEGTYKWIAFIHSKANDILPVPNRYFGVFEDGNLKIRGIEARRHDTPIFFSRCQNEILKVMAAGNTINEVKALMPKVNDIFQKYAALLKERRVPIEELVFTKRLSKNSHDYQIRDTIENSALCLLESEGKSLKAGETLKYIITKYYHNRKIRLSNNDNNNRAIPIELFDNKNNTCDVRRYTELLAETCNSVIEPFGHILKEQTNWKLDNEHGIGRSDSGDFTILLRDAVG